MKLLLGSLLLLPMLAFAETDRVKEIGGKVLVDADAQVTGRIIVSTVANLGYLYFVDGTTQTTASGAIFYGLQNSTQTSANLNTATTSSTFQDTFLSVTITPTSATSRVKVHVSANCEATNAATVCAVTLFRGATNLGPGTLGFSIINKTDAGGFVVPLSFVYIDSPATTSATTYIVKVRSTDNTNTVNFPGSTNVTSVITAEEIR